MRRYKKSIYEEKYTYMNKCVYFFSLYIFFSTYAYPYTYFYIYVCTLYIVCIYFYFRIFEGIAGKMRTILLKILHIIVCFRMMVKAGKYVYFMCLPFIF